MRGFIDTDLHGFETPACPRLPSASPRGERREASRRQGFIDTDLHGFIDTDIHGCVWISGYRVYDGYDIERD